MPSILCGLSGRFPKCDSKEELWALLTQGRDGVDDNNSRWNKDDYPFTNRMGLMTDNAIHHFDESFFSSPSKLADEMDPQIRMLLEVVYEAIVDAGLNPNYLKGSDTGVFVGSCSTESHANSSQDPNHCSGYSLPGSAHCMKANQVSFCFQLEGPSMTIDTACSSSASALSMAMLCLQAGQCRFAIVAGTNIIVRPGVSMALSKLRMLSPSGLSKAFDASADGFVRSEAVGAIVLAKVDDPFILSNRLRSYCKIVDIHINHVGSTVPMILRPSTVSQTKCMQHVYHNTGIKPSDVYYIECHGTGTPVGDPIEIDAITTVFGLSNETVRIGSIKSNIGHCEGASFICGLIKLALSFRHSIVPGSLHNITHPSLNSILNGKLQVVNSNINMPEDALYMAISNYGFGGTCAHALLQRDALKPTKSKLHFSSPPLLYLSSRTATGIYSIIEQLTKHDVFITNDCLEYFKSMCCPINQHTYRAVINVQSCRSTMKLTKPLVNDLKIINESIKESSNPTILFCSQWKNNSAINCLSLLLNSNYFPDHRSTILELNKLFSQYNIDITLMIKQGLDSPFRTIAECVYEITMIDYLISCGTKYDFVEGHGVSVLAAAYACKALSKSDIVLFLSLHCRCSQMGGDVRQNLTNALQHNQAFKSMDRPNQFIANTNELSIHYFVQQCLDENYTEPLFLKYPRCTVIELTLQPNISIENNEAISYISCRFTNTASEHIERAMLDFMCSLWKNISSYCISSSVYDFIDLSCVPYIDNFVTWNQSRKLPVPYWK